MIGQPMLLKRYKEPQIVTFMGFQLINDIEVSRRGDLDINTESNIIKYLMYLDEYGELDYVEVGYGIKFSFDLTAKL